MHQTLHNQAKLTMVSGPLVSIVVLNFNGGRMIQDCLSSIYKSNYKNIEIIIPDNASSDGSPEFVKKLFPDVRIVENGANLGFCEGNNCGIAKAVGDIIILLNYDTVVDDNWLTELVNAFTDPTVGIAGPQILFTNSIIIQSAGLRLMPSFRSENLYGGQNSKRFKMQKPFEVDYVPGTALAISRSALRKVGMLDPFFFAYLEDIDLCLRVKQAGYKVVVVPQAKISHLGSASWRNFALRRSYLITRNRIYIIFKHMKGLAAAKALTSSQVGYSLTLVRKIITRRTIVQQLDAGTVSSLFSFGGTDNLQMAVITELIESIFYPILLLFWPILIRRQRVY